MVHTFFFYSPGGLGGKNLKRAVAEVATVELIAYLLRR